MLKKTVGKLSVVVMLVALLSFSALVTTKPAHARTATCNGANCGGTSYCYGANCFNLDPTLTYSSNTGVRCDQNAQDYFPKPGSDPANNITLRYSPDCNAYWAKANTDPAVPYYIESVTVSSYDCVATDPNCSSALSETNIHMIEDYYYTCTSFDTIKCNSQAFLAGTTHWYTNMVPPATFKNAVVQVDSSSYSQVGKVGTGQIR
jgi:hypothetical protein